MPAEEPAAHVLANRVYWDGLAERFATRARLLWAAEQPLWGIWNIPQEQLPVLPGDVAGLDTIELGCGTGYVSAWLARRSARPVGVDNSERQLATAAAMQTEFGVRFPLVHGDAERVPYPDGSFDLAISEYGASVWCDPYRWVPEAARLLRPGGRLVFLRNSTLLMLCLPETGPAGPLLLRDLFGLHRLGEPAAANPANQANRTDTENTPNAESSNAESPSGTGNPSSAGGRARTAGTATAPGAAGTGAATAADTASGRSVEFHLPHGEWIRLLRGAGFVLDELIEVRAPRQATTDFDYVTAGWARRWPSEEVWRAHLPG